MKKVYENIVDIIKSKGFTRKEFAQKLINLQPKVNRFDETPTISTIYGYLNGRITIPIELITYIAEALDITEQELFDTSDKTKKRCLKYFVESASLDELDYFNHFINSQINKNKNYQNLVIDNKNIDKRLDEILSLLKYAPSSFWDKIILRLKDYQKLDIDL